MNLNHFDTIIVGQGLAGTLLAWALVERGKRVLVVDREEAVTASKIAAGIVTPITGQRLVKTWQLDEMMPGAIDFYARVEKQLGAAFFRRRTILRLLASEVEAQRWGRRRDDDAYRDWVEAAPLERGKFRDEFGAFKMRGAHLDVAAFLAASRCWLAERGMYRCGEVPASAAAIEISDQAVRLPGLAVTAGGIVFCQGWRGGEGEWFDWVPFRSAKGEILELEIDALHAAPDRIVNRGGWLMPTAGGRFRSGATYDWDRLDEMPTQSGRLDLEMRLRAMLAPGVEYLVCDQLAAVRPVIRESKALMGRHPAAELQRVGFFNGLGSKGVLYGPYFAQHLAAHLIDDAPLEADLDLRKNF